MIGATADLVVLQLSVRGQCHIPGANLVFGFRSATLQDGRDTDDIGYYVIATAVRSQCQIQLSIQDGTCFAKAPRTSRLGPQTNGRVEEDSIGLNAWSADLGLPVTALFLLLLVNFHHVSQKRVGLFRCLDGIHSVAVSRVTIHDGIVRGIVGCHTGIGFGQEFHKG